MATQPTTVQDELLDLLAGGIPPSRLLSFHPSASTRAQLERLLGKNRRGTLTETEAHELDEYERIEHLVRLLKARVRRKRSK